MSGPRQPADDPQPLLKSSSLADNAGESGNVDGACEAEDEDLSAIGDVDPQALFVALVLVPNSYPRNRFFDLYQRPEAKTARRRAAMVRSVIAEFSGVVARVAIVPASDGDYARHVAAEGDMAVAADEQLFTLSYQLPLLDATRVVFVTRFELSLLCDGAQKASPDEDRARVALGPLRKFALDPDELGARLSALMGTLVG